MPYVFGPVPSRRLGLSLGIDLVPVKTCTYDCLYCQVGRTTRKTVKPGSFVPAEDVLEELEGSLGTCRPDTITLAGSGEPTLHSEIDQVIAGIKRMTERKVAILTNGSLFWKEAVRRKVRGADIILPTLSTVREKTFRAIHRSHPELNLDLIIEGLTRLRQTYGGQLFLEVFLLAGYNDSEDELEGLKEAMHRICPDKIQLNTVVRPPADQKAISLDRERLEEIKRFFGERAEIIAEAPLEDKRQGYHSSIQTVLEVAKRRPLRAVDIGNVCNMPLKDVEELIRILEVEGKLRQQQHGGEIYYRG